MGTGTGTGTGTTGFNPATTGYVSQNYSAAAQSYYTTAMELKRQLAGMDYWDARRASLQAQYDSNWSAYTSLRNRGATISPNANSALNSYLQNMWAREQIADYWNPQRQTYDAQATTYKEDFDRLKNDPTAGVPVGPSFEGYMYWTWQYLANSKRDYWSKEAQLAQKARDAYKASYDAQVSWGRRLFPTRQEAYNAYKYAEYNEQLAGQRDYYGGERESWKAQKELFYSAYNRF